MNVSSSTSTTQSSTPVGPVDAMKKAMDVQAQSVLSILDSASEQSKQMTAQKTVMGNNLNLTAYKTIKKINSITGYNTTYD